MPTASFILTRATIGGKEVIRPYTPIEQTQNGVVKLLIKRYDQGTMSKYISSLKVGDVLDIKGPIPKIKYSANMKENIGMVAGGTGITPMIQVLETIFNNNGDKTQISLIFANTTNVDILLKEKLDEMVKKNKNFKVHYVLSKPGKGWNGSGGHIDEKILKSYLPPPSNKNLIFVCGPPGLMKLVCGEKAPDYSQGKLDGLLAKLNYSSEQVFKF